VRSLPPPDRAATTHPVDVGQRTEAAILAELVRRGYTVLTPFGFNHRYDLVLEFGDHFVRAQCKTGRLRNGVNLGEVDIFLVYCRETDGLYAIPVEEAGATRGSLRVAPAANNQAKRITWAADYELPDVVT
jgi:hypothetical protein